MVIRNISTLLITLTLVFTLQSCSKNKTDPGTEIFPDMVHSVAYEAFSESTLTKDGKSMMLPPANSIARGRMPFTFGPGTEEAKRAGRELINPFKPTKEQHVRGRELYNNYCLVCHGIQGKGDGPLIPKFPNPPSLTGKRLQKYKDGRMYHIITLGSGVMPGHAQQIDRDERWALVQYVKWIQETYKKKK